MSTRLLKILEPCTITRTTFTENGTTVNVHAQPEESVRFYVIDEASNPRSTLRENLKINEGICDLVVYYTRTLKVTNGKEIFCLVELKGKKIKDAVDQITDTFKVLKSHSSKKIKWKAYILINLASHIKVGDAEKRKLRQNFGRHGWRITKINDRDDLGDFLRKAESPSK
ncbi:MAG: hypothetical protein QG646_3517 [Euryarchaeota archaeon]|nr:hypothetical protein [Euryarchaeota archaeon]